MSMQATGDNCYTAAAAVVVVGGGASAGDVVDVCLGVGGNGDD